MKWSPASLYQMMNYDVTSKPRMLAWWRLEVTLNILIQRTSHGLWLRSVNQIYLGVGDLTLMRRDIGLRTTETAAVGLHSCRIFFRYGRGYGTDLSSLACTQETSRVAYCTFTAYFPSCIRWDRIRTWIRKAYGGSVFHCFRALSKRMSRGNLKSRRSEQLLLESMGINCEPVRCSLHNIAPAFLTMSTQSPRKCSNDRYLLDCYSYPRISWRFISDRFISPAFSIVRVWVTTSLIGRS